VRDAGTSALGSVTIALAGLQEPPVGAPRPEQSAEITTLLEIKIAAYLEPQRKNADDLAARPALQWDLSVATQTGLPLMP
jgi:hypothetical protein